MSDDLVQRVALVFWDTPGKPDDRLLAAIAVALEEAAKVCDPKGYCSEMDAYGKGYAAAIRAMIPKENT